MTTSNTNQTLGTFEACVREHALARPDATALLAMGRTPCTYRQFAAYLDRLGAALRELLPAGNPVIAVIATNGPDAVAAIVAALSNGICAPIDPLRPPAEMDALLADIAPAFVLADDAALARHRAAIERHGAGILRMVAEPSAPAGMFDARLEQPYRRRDHVCEHAADAALLVCTSGTTSFSRIVAHTMPRLMHVGTALAEAMSLGPADRALNTIALHHAYAITSVVGPSLVAGASVASAPDTGATALLEGLRELRPTWFTATPPVYRDLLAHMSRGGQPVAGSLRFVRAVGAAVDDRLRRDLEATLQAPLLGGYGSTEAPSSAFNPPSSNRPDSVGRALGCELAIFDGEVAVRGANVAPVYANGPREPIADPVSGWHRTGDAGYLDAAGYLYITGRLNELINVGGAKVAPAAVEEVLNAHPGVAEAVVFPLPHPTLGEHVAAAVVARSGTGVTERELIEHAARRLPRPAVPNVVHLLAEIPRDAGGKVRRRELTESFARNAPLAHHGANGVEDDALVERIRRIWQDVLEYEPVALDENFFAAGGDSLRAIQVLTKIEAGLGVTLAADTLLFAPTVRELAQAVLAQARGTQRTRIVTLRGNGSRPPLFFYDSDVNGGASYARFLLAALDSEQPVYLVRPHGALGDTIPESIAAMASVDAAMIAETRPSSTYRLAGFCAGGVVAFEVARKLEEAGADVDVLALVASSNPNALWEPLWTWTSRACRWLPPRNTARVYRTLRSIANAARTRTYPAEITNAFDALRHPLTPLSPAEHVYRDRLLRHFPKRTARAVDLIWPVDDRPILSGDPSMGWRHVANVRRHTVSGDHATVLTEHIGELGTALRKIFDSADG